MTVVGIVVEGTNDYPVFEALLERHLPNSFSRPITVKHVQPFVDATSGRYSGGGWPRVVAWCLANRSSNIETFFAPLEEGDEPCDLILIQLDGDAMEGCSPHAATACPILPCSVEDRLNTLEAFLMEWLAPEPQRMAQIVFALPTMCTESWLMAGIRPDEADWEIANDAKDRFRLLKKAEGNSERLQDYYRNKAIEAFNNSDEISRQCLSHQRAMGAFAALT